MLDYITSVSNSTSLLILSRKYYACTLPAGHPSSGNNSNSCGRSAENDPQLFYCLNGGSKETRKGSGKPEFLEWHSGGCQLSGTVDRMIEPIV